MFEWFPCGVCTCSCLCAVSSRKCQPRFPRLGLQLSLISRFFLGAGDLNSGVPVYVAGALPTEPSTLLLFLNF